MALREVVKLVVEGEDKASRELKKAERATLNLEGAVKRFGAFMRSPAGLTAVAAGAAAAVGTWARQTAKAADDMGKLSERLALPIEQLSQYAAVAERAGIRQEAFSMIVQRGQRRLEEFAKGTGEAKKTFEEFGLTSEQVRASGVNILDLFPLLADKFAELTRQGRGSAEMMKIFDSEGVVMGQVFRQGSEALEEARKHMEALGVTITKDMAQSADRFNKAWGDVTFSLEGFRNQVMPPVLEGLASMVETILGIATGVDRVDAAVRRARQGAGELRSGSLADFARFNANEDALASLGARLGPEPPLGGSPPRTREETQALILAAIRRRAGGSNFPPFILDAQAEFMRSTRVGSARGGNLSLDPIQLSEAESQQRLINERLSERIPLTEEASEQFHESLRATNSLVSALGLGNSTLTEMVANAQALARAINAISGLAALLSGAGGLVGSISPGLGGPFHGENPTPNTRQAANSRPRAEANRRAAKLGGV